MAGAGITFQPIEKACHTLAFARLAGEHVASCRLLCLIFHKRLFITIQIGSKEKKDEMFIIRIFTCFYNRLRRVRQQSAFHE